MSVSKWQLLGVSETSLQYTLCTTTVSVRHVRARAVSDLVLSCPGIRLVKINHAIHPLRLCGWVGDKVDTLLNVALESLVALRQKLLLVLIGSLHNVDGLCGTILAQLHWHGEELQARLLHNLVTTCHTGKVDKGGLDDTRLALGRTDDLLREAESCICHGEGGGTSAILGLYNLVTTKLDAWG